MYIILRKMWINVVLYECYIKSRDNKKLSTNVLGWKANNCTIITENKGAVFINTREGY